MDLSLIVGPMKSGKSLELISVLSPLAYTDVPHAVYQSARHVRDTGVVSRSGGTLTTTTVSTLAVALDSDAQVVGVDEVHMFAPGDVEVLAELLRRGVRVVAAGVDTDHRGQLFTTIRRLLELGPAQVSYRRAVCDRCRTFTATHTQVLSGGAAFLEDLPGSQALPDDGTFTYEARCRTCFVRP